MSFERLNNTDLRIRMSWINDFVAVSRWYSIWRINTMFVAELILIWIKSHISPILLVLVQLHMVTFCCIIYINYLPPADAIAVAIFVIGVALNNRVLNSVECSIESVLVLFLRSVS